MRALMRLIYHASIHTSMFDTEAHSRRQRSSLGMFYYKQALTGCCMRAYPVLQCKTYGYGFTPRGLLIHPSPSAMTTKQNRRDNICFRYNYKDEKLMPSSPRCAARSRRSRATINLDGQLLLVESSLIEPCSCAAPVVPELGG
jgi:hypothetical protein